MKLHRIGLIGMTGVLMLLVAACIKDLEQEGVYTESTVTGRIVERTSQQPVGGLTVQLVCGEATLSTTTSANDGAFSLTLTAEQQADGCRVVVSADSLYIGCTADVPTGGFGHEVYDLGVLYVDGPGLPEVHTHAVPDAAISATSVTFSGTVTDDARSTITSRGFAYSILQYPTLADGSVSVGGTLGDFTATVTGLQPGTTYYVRAYATNGVGTAYGEQQTFSTPSGLPTVQTATEVTLTGSGTAQCGGTVTDDGGFAVTARGVCWSMSPEPTTSNLHSVDGSGIGTFVSTLTGLQPSTTYYVRAYATNANGTVYGAQRTVTTPSGLPTVTTTTATSITTNSAVCGGNVTYDGGYTVIQRGVCYSTTPNPTTGGMRTTDGSGTGSFVSNLTGLTSGTTYYYRAYATNATGTVYGEERTMNTN
ncbi:MAG: fibronectin type III domain-containing protein [Bacteroidales bacterium]|nr:fibronectin type III domain-containing protein [Bacteroidales bacterium]